MEYIVDIQGFKGRNGEEFIFKEVAIMALQEDAPPSVFLFKPPLSWIHLPAEQKSENRWLEYNYLGMLWSSGDIPYYELHDTLHSVLDNALKIYVKGLQKKKWLGNIFPNKIIINIEDLRCPSLKQLPKEFIPCSHHVLRGISMCAVQNVYILKTWLLEERRAYIMPDFNGIDEVDTQVKDKLVSMFN